MYSLLNLFVLSAEGEHGPDGGERLLRHGSGSGVGRLLPGTDPGQCLLAQGDDGDKVGLRKVQSIESRLRTDNSDTYFVANDGHEAEGRADRQDDQADFPADSEANDEGAEEGGVDLNYDRHFIANTFLDFENIAATKETRD